MNLSKPRILLVDDYPAMVRIMSRCLSDEGYEVESAGTVEGALQLASASKFDLLVSDVQLPDGSGHELMRMLRAQSPVKGIAVSGDGRDEDIAESKQAGFNEYLVKPVDLDDLLQTVARLVNI